ncbi:MAG: cell wall hydrolase [Rhizobiales bacterium]|nr:cell wall hydrolase [Hyphomicrobiales bacterium]
MKKAGRVYRPRRPVRHRDHELGERRGVLREYGPFAFGGFMLVLAFAFAGHYMGQNAIAHNTLPGERLDAISAPASTIFAKGSLLPEGSNFDIVNLTVLGKQTIVETGKGDLLKYDPVKTVRIMPASVDLGEQAAVSLKEEADKPVIRKVSFTPSKAKIERSFKLKRGEKQKVIAARRVRLAEENCLARAIYFEARSETELGQHAVAKVILNRVKDPNFPKSICGVVYQGSGRRNSCQFSFACDGLPDDVKQPTAWSNSKRIALKAMAGDQSIGAIGTATNYHADYVNPKWAKNMKRLIKIGHHIFYSDTTL